jgi:hypothetical protein
MVCDAHDRGEGDIIIRFNNLCRQFSRNKKYYPANFGEKDYIISDGEDISYEMNVNNKRYQASYYQAPDPGKMDTLIVQNRLKVTMFAVANRNVHLLNSLSGAASPLPLGSPSVCFS